MSDHHHYHNSGGSSNFLGGFILGAVIGAGLVALLGTKRGQEIAEEIKEKGLSLVGDFDALMNELEEDTAESEENSSQPLPNLLEPKPQSAPPPPPPPTHFTDVQSQNNFSSVKVEGANIPPVESSLPTHIESLQSAGRRFFRGIPKRG